MPKFSIDEFNSLQFDKKKATERLDAFIKSNPNAPLPEINDKIKEILISEIMFATQKYVLDNKDPKSKDKKYYEQNLNDIKKNIFESKGNAYTRALNQMSFKDIYKYLSYAQKDAQKSGPIDFKSYSQKTSSDFSVLNTVKVSNPRGHYELFEMWRQYDKAFFAMETDGSGAVPRNAEQDKLGLFQEWQKEIDSVTINPPAKIGAELSEFVVFGELMTPDVLMGNADVMYKGSTIPGARDIVTDTLTNFFSNTIAGDKRINMQGIRKCVPQARRNAKEIIEQGNMDRVKASLQNVFKTMYNHAMSAGEINHNFIYPVVKINELIAVCQKKNIDLKEIGINEKELQNIKVLNMKYSLAKQMSELRVELGERYDEYLLSDPKPDLRQDLAYMDRYKEYQAISIALYSLDDEVKAFSHGYLSAVDKKHRSEVSADRALTFSEKALMDNPRQYIQWIKNKLPENADYNMNLNSADFKAVFRGDPIKKTITAIAGAARDCRDYQYKELEAWSIEDTLNNIERLIKSNMEKKYYIKGSFDKTQEKLEELRKLRKDSEGKEYDERSKITVPKYKELVDEFKEGLKKYNQEDYFKQPDAKNLYNDINTIDNYLKHRDSEKQYFKLAEQFSKEIQNTKVEDRIYGDNSIDAEGPELEASKTIMSKPVQINKAVDAPEIYLKHAQNELKAALKTGGKTLDIEIVKDTYAKVLTAYTLGKFRDQTVKAAKQGAAGTDEILKDITSNKKFEAAVNDLKNSKAFEKLCKEVSISELQKISSAKNLSELGENYNKLLDKMNGPKPQKKAPQQPQAAQSNLVM